MVVLVYLLSIVLANLVVLWFGPASTIFNAFILIGLDLTLRDRLHERWHNKNLWLKMFSLIAAGSIITYLINPDAWRISLASTAAFAAAALADTIVYHFFYKKQFLVKANVSNIAGAAADSILFPTIAFGSLLPWIIFGQFAAKTLGGFLWSLLLDRLDKLRIKNGG